MMSTENRLRKLGSEYVTNYQNEIQDMKDRGIARMLSEEEMKLYIGPVHYIHHHEVLKPESASTPFRIVFNSSSRYKGYSLNECWAKGPDMLNSLIGVMCRFRQGEIGIVGDITKMYNSVKLSILDQHTHRFVWRDLETDRDPNHYVLTSVTFGDRPRGVIATLALRYTADMLKDKYPMVSDISNNNAYMDDMLY